MKNLNIAVVIGLVSIAAGLIFQGKIMPSAVDPSCSSSIDPQTIDTQNIQEVLETMGVASKCSDLNLAHFLGDVVIQTKTPNLMILAADMLYHIETPGMMDLKVSLLQTAYNLTERASITDIPKKGEDAINADRLALYWLGIALEESGDVAAAQRLYDKGVQQGLWAVPEQRPMPYFSYIPVGKPFPDLSEYEDVVKILEDNYETIKEELIMHKQFPGQMFAQSKTVVWNGDWIYGRFYEKGQWFQDFVELFPKTTAVMREIQEKFGHDLPIASMRLSTLDKGTEIRPHCGGGNHKLRVQLPLYIPDGCCEIQAGNERSGYTEGKVLILDDSYIHHAWNNSTQPRSIIFVDIWTKGISEEDKEKVRNYFIEYKGVGSGEKSNG